MTTKSPKRTRTPAELLPDKRQHIESNANNHGIAGNVDLSSAGESHATENFGNPLAGFVAGFNAGVKSSPSSPNSKLPAGITLTSTSPTSAANSKPDAKSDPKKTRVSGERTPSPSGRSARNSDTPPPADSALIDEILTLSSFYDILGVARDCPVEEIRRAYLRRSRTVHPDRQGNSNNRATEAFQRLAAAYETLKDPKKRKTYDVQGEKGTFTGNGEETFSAAMSQVGISTNKANVPLVAGRVPLGKF
jgi:hypothetical protein